MSGKVIEYKGIDRYPPNTNDSNEIVRMVILDKPFAIEIKQDFGHTFAVLVQNRVGVPQTRKRFSRDLNLTKNILTDAVELLREFINHN